jgi:uncharacterized protein (DUF2147 family)
MKHIFLIFSTFGFLINLQAQELEDKIVGVWFNEDKTSKIEIYKAGETYSGKIVWLAEMEKNPGQKPKDKNNPNPKMRDREILGLNMLSNLKYSGGTWNNGLIYSPKRGIYANCKVELLSQSKLKIIVTKSGFTNTQIWTRK